MTLDPNVIKKSLTDLINLFALADKDDIHNTLDCDKFALFINYNEYLNKLATITTKKGKSTKKEKSTEKETKIIEKNTYLKFTKDVQNLLAIMFTEFLSEMEGFKTNTINELYDIKLSAEIEKDIDQKFDNINKRALAKQIQLERKQIKFIIEKCRQFYDNNIFEYFVYITNSRKISHDSVLYNAVEPKNYFKEKIDSILMINNNNNRVFANIVYNIFIMVYKILAKIMSGFIWYKYLTINLEIFVGLLRSSTDIDLELVSNLISKITETKPKRKNKKEDNEIEKL